MNQNLKWIFALSSIHTKVFKQIDRQLSIHGITFSEFLVMYQLFNAPEHTMRRIDLAESVGMSASGITRALAPMEKLGLVQKEKNTRDARVSLVQLTDAGKHILNETLATVNVSADILLQQADRNEIEAFLTLAKEIK